jgi:hypothetical protein
LYFHFDIYIAACFVSITFSTRSILQLVKTAGLFWTRTSAPAAPEDADHANTQQSKLLRKKPVQQEEEEEEEEEEMSKPFQHPVLTPQFCFDERVLRGMLYCSSKKTQYNVLL